MRLFYQAFPIRDALRLELSWTHYRRLLRVGSEKARNGYIDEAANQNWSSRALERRIGTLYYERLPMSRDKAAVIQGNEQLFASKCKLILPSDDELRAELDREHAQLQSEQQRGDDNYHDKIDRRRRGA